MPRNCYIIACTGLLAAAALAACIALRHSPAVVEDSLRRFPASIAGYTGTDGRFPEPVTQELNADASLYRHYLRHDGSLIHLYIGYYGTAKGGRTPHTPYACLPGAGWAIVDTRSLEIRQPRRETPATVNYVQARRDGINTVMLHWYQTGGDTVVSSGMRQNTERFWGRLFKNRGDGAFVQVTCQVPDDRVAEGREAVMAFAGEVLRDLPRYWPVEQ